MTKFFRASLVKASLVVAALVVAGSASGQEFASKLRNARANKQPLPPFPDMPFEEQATVVMDHLKEIVEAAGSTMNHLLKVNVWLKNQSDQPIFDRVYRPYFNSPETLPARTRLQAGGTPMGCGLEVEAIGYIPDK